MNICGAILIILTFIPGVTLNQSWSNIVDGTCKFTVNHNLDIRFEQNPLLFIDRQHANDLSSCRQLCCDHKTCNGYVWTGNDLSNEQCKLLKCSNEGTDCKNALTKSMVDKSQHEVGFITGIADSTTNLAAAQPQPQDTISQTTQATLSTTEATTLNDISQPTKPTPHTTTESSTSSLDELPKTSSPRKGIDIATTTTTTITTSTTTSTIVIPSIDNLIKDEDSDSDVTTTSSTLPTTTQSPILSQHKSVHTNHLNHGSVSTLGKRLKTKSHSNTTRKGVIPENTTNGHSDNVSLVGAFSIGLIFVLVVFFLVGKRWIEGFRDSRHKTGYTRISYLLNGV